MARTATTRTTAKAATTATTRKPGKVATVTHGPAGTAIVNPPFMLPTPHGRLGQYLRVTDRNPEGLGWTFDNDAKVWIMDGSAGRPNADMARVEQLVELFTRVGAPLDVKLTATGKARTGKAATAPATDTPAPAKAATTRKPAKAAAPAHPLAELLRAAGFGDAVIAAAVAAATGEAATVAAAPAKASGKPATTRKPAKAAQPEVTVTASKQGTRVYTLPEGVRVKAAGKAVRQAIAADVRNSGKCKGGTWHVYADRTARTLTVENEGHKVTADLDAIVTGAIA